MSSLSTSERRAAEAVALLLASRLGGNWAPVSRPDDEHPNRPSPDVVFSDGSRTAAVEVTEVRSAEWNSQFMAKDSVERAINPKDGHGWMLVPADNAVLPWPKPFVKALTRAVARAVTSAPINDEGSRVVPIERAALVSMAAENGSRVYCCHHTMNDVLGSLEGKALGQFMLVDCDDKWEHEFHTIEGREAASAAILHATFERRTRGEAVSRWQEEWLLADLGPGDDLEILYVTTAQDVSSMTAGAMFAAIDRKAPKFVERWGDFHILVLDAQSVALQLNYAQSAMMRYLPEYDVDAVVWADKSGATLLYDRLSEQAIPD